MNKAASTEAPNSSAFLANNVYRRQRTNPSLRDLFYLSLFDLKLFVSRSASKFHGAILDYGCGGSPYRELFSHCTRYARADLLSGPDIDLLITAEGKTEEPSESYQGVVSFQVLEHVASPDEYLGECHRVLSRNGFLLLTTHGMYLEHKCPDDYHRWTSQGLKHLIESHGFTVIESVKLTAGVRGAIQIQHHIVEDFIHRERTAGGLFLRLVRKIYLVTFLPLLNGFAMNFLTTESILSAESKANLYVGIGVLARKN